MLKKSQNKKSGLTLVELMVTISLIGLVIGIASSIFLGNNKIFKKGVDQYDVQSNARIAMTDITNSVRYATFIEILPDTAVIPEADTLAGNEGYIYYDASSGSIIKKTKSSNASHEIGTADGSGIAFTSSANDYTLGVSIKGTDINKKFEVASSILCLNLRLYSTSIGGSGTGSIIHYKKVIAVPTVTTTPTTTLTTTPAVTPEVSPSVAPQPLTITLDIKYTKFKETTSHNTPTYNLMQTLLSITDAESATGNSGKHSKLLTVDTGNNIKVEVEGLKNGFSMNLNVTFSDGSKRTFAISYDGTNWTVDGNKII